MKLEISGGSDDIVCYSLGKKSDELTPESLDGPYMGKLLVHSSKGRCFIHVVYDGCWAFAVTKVDEDDGDLFPASREWDRYSEVLTLEVPARTKIGWAK